MPEPYNSPPYAPTLDPTSITLWPDKRQIFPSAIKFVNEIFAGREGTVFSASGDMHRSYVRKFRVTTTPDNVVTDQDTLDDTDIIDNANLPRPYSPYFSNWRQFDRIATPTRNDVYADLNALAVETSVSREQQDDSSSWIVTVRFSTDIGERGPDYRVMFGGTQSNWNLMNPESPQFRPWLMLPVFEYGYQESTVAKQWDRDGKPFLNTAGSPLTPAPTSEVAYPTLTMNRNEREWTPNIVTDWSYAVNQFTFMGFEPGRVQVLPPTAKVAWHGRLKYYKAVWRFRFKPLELVNVLDVPDQIVTWQPLFLNAGFYAKNPANLTAHALAIFRGASRVSGQPALLAADGTALSSTGTPTFVRFNTYPTKDFTTMFNGTMVP